MTNLSTPPWMAQGEPLQLSEEMKAAALPSRRFPKPVPEVDEVSALTRLGQVEKPNLSATDADLRLEFSDAWMHAMCGTVEGSLLSHAILMALANKLADGVLERNEVPLGERIVDVIARHKGLEYCVDAFIEMQHLQVNLVLDEYQCWKARSHAYCDRGAWRFPAPFPGRSSDAPTALGCTGSGLERVRGQDRARHPARPGHAQGRACSTVA